MADRLPIVLRENTLGSEELRVTDEYSTGDNLSIGNNRIVDVADPIDDNDAVNLGYLISNTASTEHSALLNLLNEDHPQYVLKSELSATAQGHMCGSHMVGCPIVPGATVDNLHDFVNDFASAGQRTGGIITDAGGATVNVTAGTGYLKANDIDTDELIACNWPASLAIAIPIDTIRYIGVEWNGGTPQVTSRAANDFDRDTDWSLGVVINENNVLIVVNNPWWVADGITNIIQRFDAMGHIVRCEQCGGLTLGTSGVRNITLSGGQLWSRFNDTVIAPIDTSIAGDFTLYYVDNADDWHIDIGETQYPITHWNDTTQAPGAELVAMGANRYANWWVYLLFNGDLALVYPQAEHVNVAAAEAESPPASIPEAISHPGLFVGRIIFKEGVAAPVLVQSAFTTVFQATLASDHGSLVGLGDDDHLQYHTDARAAAWLAANHETTYDHTAIWGAGLEDQLWTQGAAGNPVSEANLTFNGTILTSPQYGAPANVILVPAPLGGVQVGTTGNPRGNYAVDLQGDRFAVTDVAGGANSVITGGQDNTNTGICSVIGGGHDNDIIASDYSVIVGGEDNDIPTACGTHNSIGGGNLNVLIAAATYNGWNIITGGINNSIQGQYCVTGGYDNDITSAAGVRYSVISGGRQNDLSSDYGTISGGYNHTASGDYGVVGGGRGNTVASEYSVIAGGFTGTIDATSTNATICGGDTNSITTSNHSFIGGGDSNTITASTDSAIVGGDTNSIPTGCGTHNFIGGGISNVLVSSAGYKGINTIAGGGVNSIQGQYSFIGGGNANTITLANGVQCSTIVGGQSHNITSDWSIIGGGYNHNITDSNYSTIVGGDTNIIPTGCGTHNFIGGGDTNLLVTATTNNGQNAIVGGINNSIQGKYCFIGGGYDNDIVSVAGDSQSAIVGGHSNLISTSGIAFIGSGYTNSITGSSFSSIVGGDTNIIPTGCGTHNFIGGGDTNLLVTATTNNGWNAIVGGINNSIQGKYCFIGGGDNNDITSVAGAQYGAISGGDNNNIITSDHSFIGGGDTNAITVSDGSTIVGGKNGIISYSAGSTICGGNTHSITGSATTPVYYNTIAGGQSHEISFSYRSAIVGGWDNEIIGIEGSGSFYHVIIGGWSNSITGGGTSYNSILSGSNNTIAASSYTIIAGGRTNSINTSNQSMIGCGWLNIIPIGCGNNNFIGGGADNILVTAVTNNGSNFIGSGDDNSIQGKNCVICGGDDNDIILAAGAIASTICGGLDNSITNSYAIIGGGRENTVSGIYGTVYGGYLNSATAENSGAQGRSAVANKYGQSSQAAGRFTANGDAQTSILVARNQTTDATPTELFLDGVDDRLTIPVSTSWFFTIKVIARQTNDDFSINAYHIEGTFSRDAGNAAVDYQATITSNEEDAAWDCVVSADVGNQALIVTVTGAAANNINWVARVELVETTG